MECSLGASASGSFLSTQFISDNMKAFTLFKAAVTALFAVEVACLDTASKCVCRTKANQHIKTPLGSSCAKMEACLHECTVQCSSKGPAPQGQGVLP